MSLEIRNIIKPATYKAVESLDIVTKEKLDELEDQFYAFMQAHNFKIGRRGIREIMVETISDNFGLEKMGITPLSAKKEISDKTIRKYKKERKNGFQGIRVK
ncbi:hypothetical protein [Providencia phage PSTCR6]|nr:hypothetical protein [Providencia phage PSTCR6]